jgi:SAM-dependent methyltransferase
VERRSENGADGYVEDIPYTFGYHPELDPARMQAVLRRAGFEPPEVAAACELGYGQGMSLAIHAVAGGAAWWGTDLIPSHAAHVRALVAGTDARLEAADQTFAVFCARDDLPPFDFIGLHGVWSWVSAANRDRIVAFLQRRLRPGGVFYLSYNALPGWAPMLPLRDLLMRSVQAAPAAMPLAERIEHALRDVAMRLARDPSFEEAHPGIEAELRTIRGKRTAYLAHELFNRDWAPMHPDEVAAVLRAAGLRFAAFAGDPGEGAAGPIDGRFRCEYWVMGELRPAQRESVQQVSGMEGDAPTASRRKGCRVLNTRLLALALESPDPAWFASPVSGGGVEVGYTTMLLLEAWQRGLREPDALAREAQATLARLGQRLVRDGVVVVERDRSLALLIEEGRALPSTTLPRLAALHALPCDA